MSIESCYCLLASGQGCRFTRVAMENCSTYFHIKQDIKVNPFEGNPEFTTTQIITYLSILQAISGSERKTFQSKKMTFTNFYIFITKTNGLHFRFEGGRGGSHWDIHISHFRDTDPHNSISYSSPHSYAFHLGSVHWKPSSLLPKSIFYTLGEDIQST